MPVVSLPVPCVLSCPTTCTRRAGKDAFPATFVTVCGLGACRGPHVRQGVFGCDSGGPHPCAGHRNHGRGLFMLGFDAPGLELCRVEGDCLAVVAGDVQGLAGGGVSCECVVQRLRVGVVGEWTRMLWLPCDEFDAHGCILSRHVRGE